ncbi:MAG: dTDP-4-dehydrorhamnose reductase [Desulfobulbaceae bacterium]|jgi:dTDP-4-dehydrorhamnose reductase|nr:dTDP-4-dehydrorhamnose reductase [Desulfobulbaceae bacterium]
MKILIVGSNGQLGTDCRNILSQENDVLGLDIPAIDIGDEQSVARSVATEKPDVIINCAAYTAVDACEDHIEECWRANAQGPKNLAIAARARGCRLIHISTDYVFDGHRPPPESYLEHDATNPLSQYGQSKLAGEQAVAAALENHVILRTAWLYSAFGKNFLKTMLRLSLAAPEAERKVVGDQHGSLTWSYTLAQQIRKLLDSNLTGVFHATAEGHSTWYQGASYFLEAMGVPHRLRSCATSEYPTKARRPANSILENQRLNEAGISTFVSWQEDITTFVDMYREHLLKEAKELIAASA